MIMNRFSLIPLCLTFLAIVGACRRESSLRIEPDKRFVGKDIALITYDDSVTIASGRMANQALVLHPDLGPARGKPVLTQLIADGKVRAYFVLEPGEARLDTGAEVARGTRLNDLFARQMHQLDSVDNLDDIQAYMDYALSQYDEDRTGVASLFFLNEWIRFANSKQIDSLLVTAPESVKQSRRKEKGIKAARLRDATAPGSKFVDFEATQPNGKTARLSDFVGKGKPVIVDFWASWCPYCIKELPELKELYASYKERGVEIVGVAVRDEQADTQAAVGRHSIPWPVIYNAKRIPYGIYGFAGIPHHILIDGNGIILSRGENVKQLEKRLQQLLR